MTEGRSLDGAPEGQVPDELPVEDERWPFGFILTIAMVSIYLAYRLIQGLVLLVDWLF